MTSRKRRSVSTAVLALVLATAATRWLLEATEPLRHPASSQYDALLLALAAWVLLGCAAWAVVIGVAAVVETTSAGRLPATAWVGCPRSLRRLLLAGLGVALVGAGPLQSSATASAEAPLPVPARPVGARPRARQAPIRQTTSQATRQYRCLGWSYVLATACGGLRSSGSTPPHQPTRWRRSSTACTTETAGSSVPIPT